MSIQNKKAMSWLVYFRGNHADKKSCVQTYLQLWKKLLLIPCSRFMYRKPNVKNECVNRFPDESTHDDEIGIGRKMVIFCYSRSLPDLWGRRGYVCLSPSSANFFFSFMQCLRNIGKESVGTLPNGRSTGRRSRHATLLHEFFPTFCKNVGLVPCGIWNSPIRHCCLCLDRSCLRNPGSTTTL